jgi:hypothetical protein
MSAGAPRATLPSMPEARRRTSHSVDRIRQAVLLRRRAPPRIVVCEEPSLASGWGHADGYAVGFTLREFVLRFATGRIWPRRDDGMRALIARGA